MLAVYLLWEPLETKNLMGFHGIFGNFMGFHGISWDFHGILEFDGIFRCFFGDFYDSYPGVNIQKDVENPMVSLSENDLQSDWEIRRITKI